MADVKTAQIRAFPIPLLNRLKLEAVKQERPLRELVIQICQDWADQHAVQS